MVYIVISHAMLHVGTTIRSPRRICLRPLGAVASVSSSATPSGGPYSSTDIVSYSNDVNNRHISSEEFRHNNLADTDRERERRNLSNGHERRPNSLNTSPKSLKTETKVTNIERPGREKDQDWDNLRLSQQFDREAKDRERTLNVDRIPLPDEREEKTSNNKAALRGTNCFKPIGARNNFVTNRDPQIITNHYTVPPHPHTRSQSGPSREPEDLVAMGTIWNPNNGPPTKNSNNSKSFNAGNPTATQINVNSLNPALTMSKKYPTSRISQLTNNSGNRKEAEPRYADPIVGSPASFQQRLAELQTLESETVRWERNRKFKKKKQQDTS